MTGKISPIIITGRTSYFSGIWDFMHNANVFLLFHGIPYRGYISMTHLDYDEEKQEKNVPFFDLFIIKKKKKSIIVTKY